MEKKENSVKVPAWVKIVGELSPAVQQMVGTIASQTVQNLCLLNIVSAKLVSALYHEAINCVVEAGEEPSVVYKMPCSFVNGDNGSKRPE